MKRTILAIVLAAIFVPVAQASPCDALPPTPIYLWQFGCLYSGPDNVPVVEEFFTTNGITDLRWRGVYEFREALPTSGEWSRALFYATEAPPKDHEKTVVYCHVRNGKKGAQVLACVVGDGKWNRKPKETTRIDPPLVAGQPFRVELRYVSAKVGRPGALVASLLSPLPAATYFAQLRIESPDLPALNLRRVQLGHPESRDPIDRPSNVVIREGSLMDRTHQ